MRVPAVLVAMAVMIPVVMMARAVDRANWQEHVAMGTSNVVLVPPEAMAMLDRVVHPANDTAQGRVTLVRECPG